MTPLIGDTGSVHENLLRQESSALYVQPRPRDRKELRVFEQDIRWIRIGRAGIESKSQPMPHEIWHDAQVPSRASARREIDRPIVDAALNQQ